MSQSAKILEKRPRGEKPLEQANGDRRQLAIISHREKSEVSAPAIAAALRQKLLDVIDEIVPAERTRRAYQAGAASFFDFVNSGIEHAGFDRATLMRFKAHLQQRKLSASSVNVPIAAVKKLAEHMEALGMLSGEQAGGIARVHGAPVKGQKAGNWLTSEQAVQLLNAPSRRSLKGLRDRVILGMLLGAGIRRDELANLKIGDVQQRDGRWTVPDLMGKGEKRRLVPIPSPVKAMIDEFRATADKQYNGEDGETRWVRCAVPEHLVFGLRRHYADSGMPSSPRMSANAIYDVVKDHAAAIGMPEVGPHDLRRTFARLTHKAKAPLDQIQQSLGHSSVSTTERYVGAQQNLAQAPCDLLEIWGME